MTTRLGIDSSLLRIISKQFTLYFVKIAPYEIKSATGVLKLDCHLGMKSLTFLIALGQTLQSQFQWIQAVRHNGSFHQLFDINYFQGIKSSTLQAISQHFSSLGGVVASFYPFLYFELPLKANCRSYFGDFFHFINVVQFHGGSISIQNRKKLNLIRYVHTHFVYFDQ